MLLLCDSLTACILQVDGNAVAAPGMLFDEEHPASEPTVQACILQCIRACPVDIRSTLLRNVILVGGVSLYPDMPQRLTSEVQAQLPEGSKLRVIATRDRFHSSWKGASVFAGTLSSASWQTREELQ